MRYFPRNENFVCESVRLSVSPGTGLTTRDPGSDETAETQVTQVTLTLTSGKLLFTPLIRILCVTYVAIRQKILNFIADVKNT